MLNDSAPQTEQLLRMPEVEKLCGLKRSSIYRRIAEGSFVKPVSLGGRAVAFPSSQVQRWIADRIASAQGVASK
jgi:prophage regulatory protein